MRYVVAKRRNTGGSAPSAREAVRGEPEVRIVDDDDPDLVTIETTPERAAALQRKLSPTHVVEPEIRRPLH